MRTGGTPISGNLHIPPWKLHIARLAFVFPRQDQPWTNETRHPSVFSFVRFTGSFHPKAKRLELAFSLANFGYLLKSSNLGYSPWYFHCCCFIWDIFSYKLTRTMEIHQIKQQQWESHLKITTVGRGCSHCRWNIQELHIWAIKVVPWPKPWVL